MKNSGERLHQLETPLYAITGSVGTGKTTVTRYLQELKHPCLDADQLIKLIYQEKETVQFIASLNHDFVQGDQVDFPRLRQAFFNHPKVKEDIQQYLYSKMKGVFLNEYAKLGTISYLFYDIPLLFENSLKQKFDYIITVYCPRKEQLKRIMQRDGTPLELAEKMIASQMDIVEKSKRSDYVLHNTSNKADLFRQVDALLENLNNQILSPLSSTQTNAS